MQPMMGPDLGGGAEYVGLVFMLVGVALVGLIIQPSWFFEGRTRNRFGRVRHPTRRTGLRDPGLVQGTQ